MHAAIAMFLLLLFCPDWATAQQVETSLPLSQRLTISLAAGVPEYIADAASGSSTPQSQWWFENTKNSTSYSSPAFMESNDTSAYWQQVGLPYDANIPRTFINQTSGGGQGSLTGQQNWYRLHFKIDPKYAGQKFMLNIEGSHTAVQVFINGTLLPGISAVAADAQATHVVGFIPVIVDLTPYLHTDGVTDNVIAVDVSRGDSWFEQPGFSGAFRFGQAMACLFRNVYLYITNPVHIPLNVYSNQKTWGTYVGTVSEVPAAEGTATAASAVVEVQTNVLNETASAQQVTLTTQIVDAQGNVVVTAPPITQSVPAMTPSTFPSGPTPMFQQLVTVPNPTLWYPNNSTCGTPAVSCGTPYMYKVYHIVSVNGVVVDSMQSPLGIRTITWDPNFPYFNGHAIYLWGGSSRYDYPALGSSVPDEQWWRDMAQIAAQGGNVWRVGHSTSSEELVEAADAYGIMIDQPSGDGEGYWNATSNPTADDLTLKQELHRDMIVRDRNHPSILDWEEDNGGMNPTLADDLATLETQWDNINPRVQADRTYKPAYAFMDECDGAGCEAGNKEQNTQNPAFGAEYWDNMGTGRGLAWDYELAFAAPYLDDWRQGREANAFGMAQWYFADSPGEVSLYAEFQNQPPMVNMVRSLGYSSVDMNRFPRLLYYIYQANWIPYSIQPVVHLAHHWNRAYQYTPGTPIQENAFSNCPVVRLLINGVPKDPVTGAVLADQTPNPWNINSHADLTQNTTVMPGQVHWIVNWTPGMVTAECIDVNGNVVPGVTDSRTTAGPENKIVLSVVPEVTRPDGTSFQWTANGSDAAFVQAEVEDGNGNIVPTAADNVTFTVTGPATYMGGSQQYVADPSWTTYYQDAFSQAHSTVINGLPYAFFHSPGDPELNFEGGLQKIALRSTFTPGTVSVTATAPGLVSGSVTLTSVTPPAPPQSQPPAIIVPPVDTTTTAGYSATFTVAASGSGTLTYQWSDKSGPIAGATGSTYTTPATTLAENGDTFTVIVTSSFGSVTSNPVTLTVDAPANVAITSQPASQSVVVGQAATLTVVATGSPALTYQWYQVGSGAIAGATQSAYTTPILTATGTESLYVIVGNPLGHVQSSTAVVTVAAPTPLSITTQPISKIVTVNEPVQFTAVVAGSAPYNYQWQFTPTGGSSIILTTDTQLSNTIAYTIPSASFANVGSYTVTVDNAAKVPVTSVPAQISLAPPGVNLALDKTATSSSTQNACANGATTPPYTGTGCLGPENAVDGDLATRWGSATAGAPPTPPVAGVDPSWLQVDLGSVQAFNTVIINWENAYATQYQIQYTSGDPTVASNWLTAFANNAGTGGVDQESFPTVQGRYIRLVGEQRATQYGYSVYEFQVYNVAQCGGTSERYTVNSSNPNVVTDNLSGLTWTRTIQTDTAPGSQFTGVDAVTYCSSLKMRIPAEPEALGISGNNNATCAFPGAWSTWTSTVDPNDASETAIVNFDGTTSWNVTNNYPGETLCVAGVQGSASLPIIMTQPANQTVVVGQTATFTVVATGNPAPTYQWFKNATAIAGATAATYTTPATATTDNGALFTAVVTNSAGSITSGNATLTVTASPACTAVPSAPAGLTATAVASSGINLSWTAVTPPASCAIISYALYRSTTPGFTPSSSNLISSTSATNYSDTGLTGSTTYYYLVQATDSAGTSPASNQASATSASAPVPDFTLLVSSSSLTVTAGASGAETVTVTPENGFPSTSAVALTCSGLPAGATCSFSPTTVNATGDLVSTLTVTTIPESAALRVESGLWFPGSVLAALLCLFSRKKSRSLQSLLLVLSAAGLGVLSGCVSSSAHLPPNPFQPATSTVTVTATAGLLQHTATFVLTVQPGKTASASPVPHPEPAPWFPTTALAGALWIFGRKKPSEMQLSLLAASVFGISALTGCGGVSYKSTPPSNPQPATPSITTQPASQTVIAGQTATFTVVASGAGTLTYQWSKNGAAVSGATAASYTTPVTSMADNGAIYNAAVTAAGGSVTSNAAVLTVTSAACGTVPSAPTGLAATASSSTAIGLSWAAVAAPANCTISSYSVYRSTASAFTPSSGNLIASGLTSPSYSDTGLSPSTTYYYAVEAVDAYGSSAPSAQASSKTQSGGASCIVVPSAPTGLTAAAASSSAIGLSWSAVTPSANCAISSYSVYRSTVSGFTPSSSNLVASGVIGTTYSNSGLAASTTYYYAVEAVDADGSSAASTQASATTQSSGTSMAEIVAIAAGGPAQSNANGGDYSFVADEYYSGGGNNGAVRTAINLTQPGDNAAPMGVYQNGRVGVSTYTIPGLASGAQYTVLLHFAETYFTAAGARQFNVAINGKTVLTNLDVYATVGKDAALVEQFTATANSSGQIVVAFTDGAGNQPLVMGIEVRGVPSACALVPSASPTGLTAAASSPSIINLSWTAVAPPPNCAITYNLFASTTRGFTPSSANLIASGLTNTTYSNTGLTASTTYYYAVEAVDPAGASAASTQASAETNSANSCVSVPSSPPTGLTATASSSSTIGLSWTPITVPANCTNITYNLYGSTSSGFTPSANNEIGVGLTGASFVNNALLPSTTYFYAIEAVDEDGPAPGVSPQVSAATLAPETTLTAVTVSANEIDLSWPASTAAAPVTYTIFRNTASSFKPSGSNEIGTTKSNWFQDVLASASTAYYYMVQASGPSGTAAPIGPVSGTTLALGANPPFWDASNIPPTAPGDVMVFKFLNRTNGQYRDDQITWSAVINGVATSNTIAAQPTFSMPANASGRMYFYLGNVGQGSTDYYDFIEYTIGTTATPGVDFFNGDTTRVDAFGVKLAFQLTCGDGTNIAVGENTATFAENRATTFQRYLDAVPTDFQPEATLTAPYRIIEPGAGGFNAGGPYQDYYTAYIADIWSFNGITIPLAGPNGSGLTNNPALSAAIYRHSAPISGTPEFDAAGNLTSPAMWGNPSAFYQTDPADHYAKFFHAIAINGQQYAFPYDDSGGYSSDVSCNSPSTLIVAIGW